MDKALRYIGLAVIFFGIGLLVTRLVWPRIHTVVETKIEYKDRPIAPRDTANAIAPEIRTFFLPGTETIIRDTIYVPMNFNRMGVISARPITFRRGDVVLTYYADSSYVQDRFKIPRPRWGYSISTFTGFDPFARTPTFGIEGALRLRRVTLYARSTFYDERTWQTVGVRIRILGYE